MSHTFRLRLYHLLPLRDRWKVKLAWALSPRLRVGAHVVVRDAARSVLVLTPSYTAELQLPGGIVEYGESADAAVEREVREELGTRLVTRRLLGWHHDPASRQIRAVYAGTLDLGAIQLSAEHTGWAFCPEADLPSALQAILAAFQTA